MSKKIPQRMCVSCRQMKDKNELTRIVKSSDGNIEIDPTFKKNGRGAYICKNVECIEKCKKSHALSRAFKCAVDSKILDELKNQI